MTGCAEQQGRIDRLEADIRRVTDGNTTRMVELQQLNQKLSILNQEVRNQQAKRNEFEGKSEKTAATEEKVAKYVQELEENVKNYTEAVAAYRRKHLVP